MGLRPLKVWVRPQPVQRTCLVRLHPKGRLLLVMAHCGHASDRASRLGRTDRCVGFTPLALPSLTYLPDIPLKRVCALSSGTFTWKAAHVFLLCLEMGDLLRQERALQTQSPRHPTGWGHRGLVRGA